MLTFDRPEIPSSVNAAFYKLRVRPYVPPPLRCFKCQKFGHSAARCKSEQEICVCGHSSHRPNPCPTPPKCPNCQGTHSSRSKDCRVYKIEQEIQKVKATSKELSFKQARAVVTSGSYALRGSYSNAVQNENKDNRAVGKERPKPNLIPLQSPNIPESHSSSDPQPNSFPPPPPPPSTPFHPPNSLTSSDDNTNSEKPFSPSNISNVSNLPIHPPLPPGEKECGSLTDDGGGPPFTAVKLKRKKGWPKGKPRGPRPQRAESE